MIFTFPLLLGGLLLVGIPVLLHLLMRQKPKTVLFPAFRFLVQRHRTNLTKLRLRHLLLLAMRMLLLAAIVLALAQPKLTENPWSLPSGQAVAAVFVFDTSASMEYTVAASQTRLKDAKKRAVEMLKLLPDHSEVVVLDSAESTPLGRGDWLPLEKAAERIGQLKLQAANGPVSVRVAAALELLARLANAKEETQRGKRPRVLCVFSDQTTASWDSRQRKSLQVLANQVPPNFERLAGLRPGIAEQTKLLAGMAVQMPSASQSFPDQALIGLLEQLDDRLAQTRPEEHPDQGTQALLAAARSKQQELLGMLDQTGDGLSVPAREYRTKLKTAVLNSLRHSAGFNAFYVDVGVERPSDLALTGLQIIREPAANDGGTPLLKLRIEAQASAEDARSTLGWHANGPASETAIEVKAGKREHWTNDLAPATWRVGHHQAKVIANPVDQLPINNSRYLTFAIRRVLVLTDSAGVIEAQTWAKAVEASHFGAAWYSCDVKKQADIGDRPEGTLNDYAAIFLYGVKEPEEKLWAALADFVGRGGGLGVIPGGKDMKLDAYNASKAAQDVLPARFEHIVNKLEPGADWDWHVDIFKHALLHPFQEWRQAKWDFVVQPRGATQYWQVEPLKEKGTVLVRYADDKGRPALLERLVDLKRGKAGRVLMFTTPPGVPGWNNYRDNSFYVILALRAIGYLTGDDDRPTLNFVSGQTVPRVPVPITSQTASYKLYRDGPAPPAAFVATITAELGHNEVRVPQAAEPGNYTLRTFDDEPVGWFSVNLPAEESDLTKVSRDEIEAVLGPDAVVTIEARTDLSEAMRGHISRPWELMPELMMALLLLLALENLLANKFYRREGLELTR